MATVDGNKITFDSGREWEPDSDGIVGLSPDLQLFEGYDSRAGVTLSIEQRHELADVMIARWRAFRDADPV